MTTDDAAENSCNRIKGIRVGTNVGIARSLFQIIFETLHEEARTQNSLTPADLTRIQHKLEDCWLHVESLFDNTCAQCLEIPWYVRDERRKDAITRIVYARIVAKVPERTTIAGANYPRLLVGGLQSNISTMLSVREWNILNEHAKFIFEFAGSDDDAVLVKQLAHNRAIQLLAQRIFLTLLSRFRGFSMRRQEFVRTINQAAVAACYRMTDLEFCDIFDALFGEYIDLIQTEEGRLRITLGHGEEYFDKLKTIVDAYLRFKGNTVMISRFPVSRAVR